MADIYSLTIRADTRDVKRARGDLGLLSESAARASRENQRLAKSSHSVAKASRFSSNGLRQTSMQLSQVAQQASATGNWVQALAIQLPDLALAFGPVGIALGAVAGGLLSYVSNAEEAGEETETFIDRVEGLELAYSDLNAEIRTALELERARRAEELTRQIEEQAEIVRRAEQTQRSYNNAINAGGQAAARFGGGISPEKLEESRKAAADARGDMGLLELELKSLNERYAEYLDGSAAAAAADQERQQKLRRLVESIQSQAGAIGKSGVELAIYEANLLGAGEEERRAIRRAYEQITAEEQRQEALRESAKANQEFEQSWDRLQGKIDPVGAELKQFGEDVAVIQEAVSRGIITEEQADNMVNNLAMVGEAMQQNKTWSQEWIESLQVNLTDMQRLTENVANTFSNQFGDAFESILFDFQSVGDAGRDILEGLARATVNAVGQMIAQWLAYQAVQLAFNSTAGTAAATALTAEAAAQQQLAALNTYAATAAIPVVGPAAAPGAAAAALGATAPFVAAVAGLSSTMAAGFAGARQMGGSVSGGSSYLVGESGPEVVTMGGSGVVTPSTVWNQGNGDSPNVTVNLIEDNSRAGQVETRRGDDGSMQVDAFVADITQGGSRARAMESVYGLRRQGR